MFIVTISASGSANAGLLDQQQPALFEDSRQPMVSDLGLSITRGDTFMIPGDGSLVRIGLIEWWGWYKVLSFTSMDFLDDFTVEIYEVENGVPKAQPLHSFHIGDVIENAVFTPAGVIRGSSRGDRWVIAHDLGTGAGLQLHRYEALFTDNPIELKSGTPYMLSIVNNNADGGLYILNDPEPPTFIVDDGFKNLPWSWARVDHELADQSSSWERQIGVPGWTEISSSTVYNPDLAFSLYDCAGNVDPIVYLRGGSEFGDSVYRISNLPIGDTEYNLKFEWGTPSNMSGHLEFKNEEDAAAASDAINTVLNAQLPTPPVDTTSTNLSFPSSDPVYVVPWFTGLGGAAAVQNVGPLQQFPDAPAPWFRLGTKVVGETEKAMYTVFIKLGEVVPESTFSPVFMDIKPGSCPNPLNLDEKGVLPLAILGTQDLDVKTIDPATLRLSKEGVAGSVAPLRWSYEDVGTPLPPGGEQCDCWDLNGDGYMDLSLKFKAQDVVGTLGLDENVDATIPLTLKGHLHGCGAIQGQDCVWIKQAKQKK